MPETRRRDLATNPMQDSGSASRSAGSTTPPSIHASWAPYPLNVETMEVGKRMAARQTMFLPEHRWGDKAICCGSAIDFQPGLPIKHGPCNHSIITSSKLPTKFLVKIISRKLPPKKSAVGALSPKVWSNLQVVLLDSAWMSPHWRPRKKNIPLPKRKGNQLARFGARPTQRASFFQPKGGRKKNCGMQNLSSCPATPSRRVSPNQRRSV